MATSGPGFILPQFQGDAYTLQNKQALAQMLMQGATQNQASQIPTNGAVVPKFSIGAGLAQLGQALLAGKMQNDVSQGYRDLGQRQMGFLQGAPADPSGAGQVGAGQSAPAVQAFSVPPGGGEPAAQVQPGAQQPAAAGGQPAASGGGGMFAKGGPLNPGGKDPGVATFMFYNLGPSEYSKQFVAPYAKPTDATLMALGAGMDPAAANAGALRKGNYVAPISTPGVQLDPFTHQPVAFIPTVPNGGQPIYDAGGRLLGMGGIPGAQAVIAGNAAAEEAGRGSQLPGPAQYDAQGNILPSVNRTQAANPGGGGLSAPAVPLPMRNNNPGAVSPGGSVAQYPTLQEGLQAMDKNLASYAGKPDAGTLGQVITKWVGSPPNAPAYIKDVTSRLGVPADTPIDLTNPAQRQAVATAIMLHENGPGAIFASASAGGQAFPAAPLGTGAGRDAAQTNQQSELSKKWTDLSTANSTAQTTTSYLQNISALASKAATGQQADRVNFANSLLSMAGSEKATDQLTANNLLDKYSNQIIARLGAGGLGTDAARSILQAANPNSHMTEAAIKEAAANLVGANQMTQAKTRLLAPFANKRDPAGYNAAELAFDQAADPRIWQMQGMSNDQAQAYIGSLAPDVRQMLTSHIQALTSMGAL